MKEIVEEKFKEIFGTEGRFKTYFAPGRVNLIGEHTDYNGGHVFPCALTLGTYATVRQREDRNVILYYSLQYNSIYCAYATFGADNGPNYFWQPDSSAVTVGYVTISRLNLGCAEDLNYFTILTIGI